MVDGVAKQQLADKIKLENSFKAPLKRFFRIINKDVKVIYRASGRLPDFALYEDDLAALLRIQYRKVADKFSRTIRSDIKKFDRSSFEVKQDLADELDVETVEEEESRVDDAILALILGYIVAHSIDQSRIILNTVNKEYERLLNKVISDFAAQGVNPTREDIADSIASKFAEKIDGKVDTIALTETQNIAEKSKVVEATVLVTGALLVGGVLLSQRILKRWNAILDERVRGHHKAANGQMVRFDIPFTVNGEQLMFPGDTTLGASPNNIINCRCTATFEVS